MCDVLLDPSVSMEMRQGAAERLVRSARPAARAALLAAVDTDDPALLLSVAQSLGRIGGPEAFAALRGIAPPSEESARRAVAFAATLISYRLGLGEALFSTEHLTRVARLDPAHARKLTVRRANEGPPARPPSLLAGVKLVGGAVLGCRHREYAIYATSNAPKVRRTNAIPAVIIERSPNCVGAAIALIVFAHPLPNGEFAMFVASYSGIVTHIGRGRNSAHGIAFELVSLETRLYPPGQFAGTLALEPLGITISHAFVSDGPMALRGLAPSKLDIVLPQPNSLRTARSGLKSQS